MPNDNNNNPFGRFLQIRVNGNVRVDDNMVREVLRPVNTTLGSWNRSFRFVFIAGSLTAIRFGYEYGIQAIRRNPSDEENE